MAREMGQAQRALQALLEGNSRFLAGESPPPVTPEGRAALTEAGQRPLAVVLCCADCRVPPELVFCQGVGALYVVRAAGHAPGPSERDSVAYAVNRLGVRLVAVLGHTSCGEAPRLLRRRPRGDEAWIDRCVERLRRCRELNCVPDLLVAGLRYDLKSGRAELLRRTQPPQPKPGRAPVLVWTAAWTAFAAAAGLGIWAVQSRRWPWLTAYDVLYALLTLLAVAVAITFSQAYSPRPGLFAPGSTAAEANRFRSVWLHANACWEAVNVWMTVSPLYCTGVVIYLTLDQSQGGGGHVLVYSVLSLVLSLAIYAVRPADRAGGFQRAYLEVNRALNAHLAGAEADGRALAEAMDRGERLIAGQDARPPR